MLCTTLLLPMSGMLEKLVVKLVPDGRKPEQVVELDERLLNTPPMALARCRDLTGEMANTARDVLLGGMECLWDYQAERAEAITMGEDRTDHCEDILGTYLVKLSGQPLSEEDAIETTGLLKLIGDFERIADHGANLLESARELKDKQLHFSPQASQELCVVTSAVHEVVDLAVRAFAENDLEAAKAVEPLEQVIDSLKEQLRTNHIFRLQQGKCSIESGFVWSDVLTNLERTSDHCSNIAGCLIDMAQHNMNIHASLRSIRSDNKEYREQYEQYLSKYALPVLQK